MNVLRKPVITLDTLATILETDTIQQLELDHSLFVSLYPKNIKQNKEYGAYKSYNSKLIH